MVEVLGLGQPLERTSESQKGRGRLLYRPEGTHENERWLGSIRIPREEYRDNEC